MSRIEELREALGGAHPLAVDKVKDHLETYVRAFIENAPFAVMASSDAEGNCDASPKGGKPGWIHVLDDRTLLLPDVGGNRLFQSFVNFESNPKAGFIFMIPGLEVTARVNGRVEVLEREALLERGMLPEVYNPDDNAGLVQGILVHIDEAYFHCPRSMQFADLWNREIIKTNEGRSLKSLLND